MSRDRSARDGAGPGPGEERQPPAAGFETFVAVHGDALVALARGLVGSDGDADDLAERALAAVLRRWRRVRRGEDGEEAALGAVVRSMVTIVGDGPDGADRARADRAGDPLAALGTVEPSRRVVLLLRWLERRDDAAIGRLLQLDADEVGRRARRALEELGLDQDV